MTQDCIFIKDIRPGLKNINVIFIVLETGPITLTKENREVRSFKVGDPTACINVSIWDEPGKFLAPGDIVKMTKGYASVWRNCLTLYSGKSGEIVKVGDFCMVFNEQLNMSEPNSPFVNQTVIPNQTTVMNNGNPNNGSIPQIIDTAPALATNTPQGTTQVTTNSAKAQRYSSGGDTGAAAPQINAKTGPGKPQPPRAGRGAKNLTAKNDRSFQSPNMSADYRKINRPWSTPPLQTTAFKRPIIKANSSSPKLRFSVKRLLLDDSNSDSNKSRSSFSETRRNISNQTQSGLMSFNSMRNLSSNRSNIHLLNQSKRQLDFQFERDREFKAGHNRRVE